MSSILSKAKLRNNLGQVVQPYAFLFCVAMWHSAKMFDFRSVGHGPILSKAKLRNNLGRVVHTYVPLSPSSITWYWSKDGDILRLGR